MSEHPSVGAFAIVPSNNLANGEGSITSDAGALQAAYVVTVSWAQPGARGASHVLRVAKDATRVKDADVARAAN
jgi:hypothetical protein